jgi:hypothetical protein
VSLGWLYLPALVCHCFKDFKTIVHLVGFLYIVVIADARNHEPEIFLTGQRFSTNQEAIAAVERYFTDLTKNH